MKRLMLIGGTNTRRSQYQGTSLFSGGCINAMRRMSRDRWLEPQECARIAYALARCASGNPDLSVRAWMPDPAWAIGLVRGAIPVEPDSPVYYKAVEVAQNVARFKRPGEREIAMLRVVCEAAARREARNAATLEYEKRSAARWERILAVQRP